MMVGARSTSVRERLAERGGTAEVCPFVLVDEGVFR